MVNKIDIAIIGSGTAGAAAAIFLSRQGHHITIFEKVKTPKPVGSGVMLQPSGLEVFYKLGLGEQIVNAGTKINEFIGATTKGKTILDIDFKKVDEDFFGVGVSRGAIFSIMHKELKKLGVEILTNNDIVKINKQDTNKYELVNALGNTFDGFDLVIVANGSGSKIREHYPECKISKIQPWAAAWMKVPYNNSVFNNSIIQFYKGSQKMFGFMPIGTLPFEPDGKEYVNVFWSVERNEIEEIKAQGWDSLKAQMLAISNEYKDVLDQVISIEDVVFAPYYESKMTPMYHENIAFIGDTAHAMSPQLSQGTGFALLDAYELSIALESCDDLSSALKIFSKKRIKQTKYYQFVSKIVTPIFQSNYPIGKIRDLIFPLATKIPFLRKLFVNTVLGYRKTIFVNLDKRYKLRS